MMRVSQGPARDILRRAGVDRAVAYTIFSRGWTVLSGGVSLILLTRFLTPVQQGFYYTFVNILAIQVFFELGLSTVILQFASHEKAKLSWNAQGHLEGDSVAKSRLASLLRFSLIWYGVVAGLVLLVVLPVGFAFFSSHTVSGQSIAWQIPWLWIVLVTAGSLAISPALALLEGCGLIAEIAAIQIVQSVVGSVLFWAALLSHWGLFTAPVTNTTVLVITTGWLWTKKRGIIQDLLIRPRGSAEIHWKQEVWPLQWRVAVSWLSGYFITQLYTLVLFAYHGPVAAGQMGLSLSVMSSIAAIGLAWITTKSAFFGTWIAQRDFERLDRVFFSCLWQSLAVTTFGGLSLWSATYFLASIHHPMAHRLLSPDALALMVLATIIGHIVTAEAIYLRAHKQEPFLWLSVIVGALTGLSAYLLGRPYGALGMMAGACLVTVLISLTGGTLIFRQKRHLWHNLSQGSE